MLRVIVIAGTATLLSALVAAGAVVAQSPLSTSLRDRWTLEERELLETMRLPPRPVSSADPSNAVEASAAAAALGERLFADRRLSSNGEVACASCHLPERGFQDDRSVGQGVGTGTRRTMPVVGAAGSPFLFWDGRKDSLWAQALGPLEDPKEHGTTRTQVAKHVAATYRSSYEAVFGAAPELSVLSATTALPTHASAVGSPSARDAWRSLTDAQREAVNRVFSNVGKAIAAYERTLVYGESRFDRYIDASLRGDGVGQSILSPAEVRGLRVFLGPGQCATCHSGPMLSDNAFHNTGVPPAAGQAPDRGRIDAIAHVRSDEFNCLGRYSDARPEQCGELRFLSAADDALLGAFCTPSLRNVAERAPYMHAGQIATLEAAIAHYAASPLAPLGRSELAGPSMRLRRLSLQERADLEAFLRALSSLPPAASSAVVDATSARVGVQGAGIQGIGTQRTGAQRVSAQGAVHLHR